MRVQKEHLVQNNQIAIRMTQAALIGAAIGALAPTAAAQERQDETIIVLGRKTGGGDFGERSGIPLAQVPQAVQVITADDLIEEGARSIGDALRSVPSAGVGAPRTSAYQSFTLEVRGFPTDQMRNGVRQRYYEDVDASALSNVDRIEVLKGPSSVLFGQSALGGIVSIVTKRPERAFSGSLWGGVGSYEQALAGFDVTGPLNQAAGLYFRANAEIERAGTFVDFQDIERENAALSLTWDASESVTAYLVAEWVERRTLRNPGLPLAGTLVENGRQEILRNRFLGDAGHANLEAFAPLVQAWVDIELGRDWTLTPRFSYSGFDTNFTQLRVRSVAADGYTVNRNGRFGKEDDNYTIFQIDLNGEVEALGAAHNLLLGVEFDRERASFYQETIAGVPAINAYAPTYGVIGDPPYAFAFKLKDELDGVAFYAQDLIELTDRWSVVAGVRVSDFEDSLWFSFDPVLDDSDLTETRFDHTNFQLGSTYRLNDQWSLFGGYATGFDIEATTGGLDANGDAFDPEESEQLEAGLRYSGDRTRLSASVFEIKRFNLLTADPLNPDFSVQTGEVRVRGLELEGSWSPMERLLIQGGYAYLNGEIIKSNNGDQGQQLADTPEHQANVFVRYVVPNTPVELRLGANYVGERPFSNAGVNVYNGVLASDVTLPAYVTVNLGAALILDEVRFDFVLSNALDEAYYTREFNDFSVLPGEPQQVSLRVSRQF